MRLRTRPSSAQGPEGRSGFGRALGLAASRRLTKVRGDDDWTDHAGRGRGSDRGLEAGISVSTIKDVAQAAGVSTATVSRALRGVDPRTPADAREDPAAGRGAGLCGLTDSGIACLGSDSGHRRCRTIAASMAFSRPWSGVLTEGCAVTITWSSVVDLEMKGTTPADGCPKQCCSSGSTASSRSTSRLTRQSWRCSTGSTFRRWRSAPLASRSLAGSNRRSPHCTYGNGTPHRVGPRQYCLCGHPAGQQPPYPSGPGNACTASRRTTAKHGVSRPQRFVIDGGWTALSASQAVTELLQAPGPSHSRGGRF